MKTGIYIHWPICKYKCEYCDFASYDKLNIDNKDLITAYLKEIEFYAKQCQDIQISTIFFGGGTPTLMTHEEMSTILNCIKSCFALTTDCEITTEANPDDINYEKISSLKENGINRVSLGVQSFLKHELDILSRKHKPKDIIEAISLVKNNFINYSIDIIYAIPNQSLQDIEKNIEYIERIKPPHISMYTLMIKPNTPFFNKYYKKIPSEFEEECFEFVREKMKNMNYTQYEISSFAIEDKFECRHNKIYWQYDDYIPIGPSSHGKFTQHRIINHTTPKAWMECVMQNNHGQFYNRIISSKDAIMEVLLMGLRLKEGINLIGIENELGIDLTKELNLNKSNIANLIEIKNNHLKPTSKGFGFIDYICRELC
jgi:oxygen-independent coproporphyrinogen-3 oxidase